MKREDLEKLGLTKEQIDSVCDLNNADMQPLKDDLQKSKDDLSVATEKIEATESALEKFKGVNPEALNKEIAELKLNLEKKDAEHASELADREFNNLLKESIISAKGKDSEKIMKLLDIDTLKSSKNQKDDVAAAIKSLSEDDVTKGMFGEPEAKPVGTGDIVGHVQKGTTPTAETLKGAIAEHYKQ
ncbi:phage scaffolding protein [Kineothrix sp. MB12-C1]|uniref:phage scaffolding protein n=1 Tax=Kineothrix sp. MB12-C1 TaxID=3070215 RepID=UPI0027D237C7|nr:phage scaffolding protein [Kineothrix sp. MB12-C1]WMC91254.1 phage scaffolding protein [Kineothrix sp. MB12-C1]